MAMALAESGANVVVCSRTIEACEVVSEQMKQLGVNSLALQCDVTDQDSIHHVVHQVIEKFEKIDILINNSGATWGAQALEMPLEKWHKVMEVNATGTFLMCQAVGKQMVAQRSGKIINIASIAGLYGVSPKLLNAVGYHASKGAIIAFTKDLAAKLGEYHINVNAIAPGFFPTKMTKDLLTYSQDKIVEQAPLGRLGSDDDLKGAAVYLSSRASDYVTGQVLSVDGGISAV